jgi:DNA polymerase-3 subunit delta'
MPFRAERALQLLSNACEQGRLGHAYLITGPVHVNLEAFATRFLNLVAGDVQPDLKSWESQGAVVLRPHSKSRRITIGDDGDEPGSVRNLEKMIHQTTGPGGWKFGIISDAERMTPQAQNAFLKTLEEPPARTLILLLTDHPEQLLTTILSRVIQIGLLSESGDRVYTDTETRLLDLLGSYANNGRGSIATALALKVDYETLLGEIKKEIQDDFEADFNLEKDRYKKTTDGNWLKQREDQVKAQTEAAYLEHRNSLSGLLLSWVGDVARQHVGADHLDLPDRTEATSALAETWDLGEATRRLHALRKLEQHLQTNVNESLALEVSFIDAFG